MKGNMMRKVIVILSLTLLLVSLPVLAQGILYRLARAHYLPAQATVETF